MGQRQDFSPPGPMVRRLPESRRRRMARLRAVALAVIAVVAATGVVLQETGEPRSSGMDYAAAPRPFDLFPG